MVPFLPNAIEKSSNKGHPKELLVVFVRVIIRAAMEKSNDNIIRKNNVRPKLVGG